MQLTRPPSLKMERYTKVKEEAQFEGLKTPYPSHKVRMVVISLNAFVIYLVA